MSDTIGQHPWSTTFWIMTLDQPDVPKYQQLAHIIRERIVSGDLAERQPVPSELYLQQEYGIARDTVRRAMALLREEGYVRTVRGLGTFVAPRENWPAH